MRRPAFYLALAIAGGILLSQPLDAGHMLPAAVLAGLTVVIYPLLSLMADQIRRAEAAGLNAAVLAGGQSDQERNRLWRRIEAGEIHIVLTNPETLAEESEEPIFFDRTEFDQDRCDGTAVIRLLAFRGRTPGVVSGLAAIA